MGRWLDRHGLRWLMTAGSALAVIALVGVALAPTFGWFVGVGRDGCGAVPAGVRGPDPLVRRPPSSRPHRPHPGAGLASTIFAPVTAGLASQLSWRNTDLAQPLPDRLIPTGSSRPEQPWHDPPRQLDVDTIAWRTGLDRTCGTSPGCR